MKKALKILREAYGCILATIILIFAVMGAYDFAYWLVDVILGG